MTETERMLRPGSSSSLDSAKYVIFSNGVNSYTIERGLKRLGLRPTYQREFRPSVPLERAYAFCTDERSIEHLIASRSRFAFEPRTFKLPVDDRLEFYYILQSWGESLLRFAELTSSRDWINGFPFPFCIKARYSWRGDVKVPRGHVCRTPEDAAAGWEKLCSQGWKTEDYFLQEFVEGPAENCYSTCGYFDADDPSREAILVTRKLLGYGGALPSGALVVTAPDPADLVARTRRMMCHAHYTGPFELEFLRTKSGEFCVLELNPRFWMQHGIFLDFYDNALIKRYLRFDTEQDRSHPLPFRRCLWVHAGAMLVFACELKYRQLSRMLFTLYSEWRAGAAITFYPSISRAVSFLAASLLRKVEKVLSGPSAHPGTRERGVATGPNSDETASRITIPRNMTSEKRWFDPNARGEHPAANFFAQAWWLDAVAPGAWGEAVVERGGRIIASLPYVVRNRLGFQGISMPPLTPALDPWISPIEGKYSTKLGWRMKAMEDLISFLPQKPYTVLVFSPGTTDVLPFHWHGFSVSTLYTYRLEDISDLDRIWSEANKSVRNVVRKAQSLLKVRCDLELDACFPILDSTFKRQGRTFPVSRDLIRRIDDACVQRDARRILWAEDKLGRLHAVAYIVWDERVAYYLMAGADSNLRSSGAQALLVWEAIKFASGRSKCFDFEGSMVRPIELFFRQFGGRQVPYNKLSKVAGPLDLARRATLILPGRLRAR